MSEDHSHDDDPCDRRVFSCEEDLFRAMAESLWNAPPRHNHRLRMLLSTRPPLEVEAETWEWTDLPPI